MGFSEFSVRGNARCCTDHDSTGHSWIRSLREIIDR